MIANNEAELLAMMSVGAGEALADVGDDMVKEIKSDIQSEVGGGSVYQANGSGSFSDAWKADDPQVRGNSASMLMHYESSLLSHNAATFTHSSNYGGDVENMPGIVFEGGSGTLFGSSGFWMSPRRGAWDAFNSNVDAQMDSWMRNALMRAGFDLI